MKQFAQVASTAVSEIRPTPPQSSPQHGLYAVSGNRVTQRETVRNLTTEEVIHVNLATVRESSTHRYWPTDVLVALLTADVITNN
jgi:hypothetical protein